MMRAPAQAGLRTKVGGSLCRTGLPATVAALSGWIGRELALRRALSEAMEARTSRRAKGGVRKVRELELVLIPGTCVSLAIAHRTHPKHIQA